jgi:hypothetical protein
MTSDGNSNGSGFFGSAIDSAIGGTIGGNGDATNASIVTATIIDSGAIPFTVAGNSVMAELFGGILSHLQKGRLHPALRLSQRDCM